MSFSKKINIKRRVNALLYFFVKLNECVLYLIKILYYRKPHPKTEPLSSSLTRAEFHRRGCMEWGRGRDIRPHQSPLSLRDSYSLSLVRLTRRERHTLSQWSLRRGLRYSLIWELFLLHQILLPSRAGRWFSVCSPHLTYTL